MFFFHQDDIGDLIMMKTLSFWRFLITPQAEHFSPLAHITWEINYRLFNLNYDPYIINPLIFHILNCVLVYKIMGHFTKNNYYKWVAVAIFAVNLTYTEGLLMLAIQGLPMAITFLGLAFLFWLKWTEKKAMRYFWYSLISTIASGFSFSIGVGVGVIFALVTYVYKKELGWKRVKFGVIIYTITGILSYLAGPLVAEGQIKNVTPVFNNPIRDIPLYIAFVIGGLGRGLIGRLILPGFEPRHTEVIPTVISFIPALLFIFVMVFLLVKMSKLKGQKSKLKEFIILIIFVIYPYFWAGFLRYQFGLKQALAERYAYPSLFFLAIMISLIVEYFISSLKPQSLVDLRESALVGKTFFGDVQDLKSNNKSLYPSSLNENLSPKQERDFKVSRRQVFNAPQKAHSSLEEESSLAAPAALSLFLILLVILQSINLYKKTVEYEVIPMQTKSYFNELTYVLKNSVVVVNLPLSSVINQYFYNISDLAPVLVGNNLPKFISPRADFCTDEFKKTIKNGKVLDFYEEQARDSFVRKVFDVEKLEKCINS